MYGFSSLRIAFLGDEPSRVLVILDDVHYTVVYACESESQPGKTEQ
jgi:hypothetical protein